MKGAMILMLLLLYPVLVTARVSTRTTNRRPSRDSNERLTVTVKTSTQERADTDDSVHLRLFGSHRKSPYLELDTAADDFERGAVDVFILNTPYVADIQYIKLKIGDDDGWLVKDVTLEWASHDQAPMVFNFSFWLDDGRHLFAYSPYLNPARYRVTVKTGNCRFGGTDEMVTITLYNGKLQTLPYILDKDYYDDFEIDAEDVYDLTTDDIGRITAVSLTVGSGDVWFLELLSVVYVKTGQEYKIHMEKWYS